MESSLDLQIPCESLKYIQHEECVSGDKISAYFKLLERRAKLFQNLPKSFAVDTYFFSALKRNKQAYIQRSFRGRDILQEDLIIIPIHKPDGGKYGHWYLITVEPKRNEISAFDSIPGTSHRSDLSTVKTFMENILSNACENKKSHWFLRDGRSCDFQKNDKDCGVYICAYGEVLTRGISLRGYHIDPEVYRKRIIEELEQGEAQLIEQVSVESKLEQCSLHPSEIEDQSLKQCVEILQKMRIPDLLSPIQSPLRRTHEDHQTTGTVLVQKYIPNHKTMCENKTVRGVNKKVKRGKRIKIKIWVSELNTFKRININKTRKVNLMVL